MATGNSGKAKRKAASSSSAAPGRPARTRVPLPDGSTGSGSAPAGPAKRRPLAPPRPWYRKGWFWFGVIVVEAIVAFALSVRFMPDTEDVALDGADLGRFCTIVADSRSLATDEPARSAGEIAQQWGRQADILSRLQPVAPEDVRPDIADLVVLTRSVSDLAADVEQRNLSDPAYDGTGAINAKIAQVESEGAVATRRLNLAVLKGCGIDLAVPLTPPTTAAVVPGPATPDGGTSVAPDPGGDVPDPGGDPGGDAPPTTAGTVVAN